MRILICQRKKIKLLFPTILLKVGLEKGDKVTFTNQYTEQEYQLKVFDIYNSRTNISVYMSRESLNNLLEERSELL